MSSNLATLRALWTELGHVLAAAEHAEAGEKDQAEDQSGLDDGEEF